MTETSTEELLALLREIEDREKAAERLYSSYIEELKDEEIVGTLRRIRDDEEEHSRLASEALVLIKNGPTYIRVREGLTSFQEASACLVSCGIERYTRTGLTTLEHLINERGLRCIYVSVNKSSTALREAFRRRGIETDAISFIDCMTVDIGESDKMVVSPENLTELSMVVTRLANSIRHNGFVYFDTISTLYIFHPSNVVERFIHTLIPRLKAIPVGLVLVAIEEEVDSRALAVLTAFTDMKVEV